MKASHPYIIEVLIQRAAELGVNNWEDFLPNKKRFTSRDVVNAIGLACTRAGIENNLFRPTQPKTKKGGG